MRLFPILILMLLSACKSMPLTREPANLPQVNAPAPSPKIQASAKIYIVDGEANSSMALTSPPLNPMLVAAIVPVIATPALFALGKLVKKARTYCSGSKSCVTDDFPTDIGQPPPIGGKSVDVSLKPRPIMPAADAKIVKVKELEDVAPVPGMNDFILTNDTKFSLLEIGFYQIREVKGQLLVFQVIGKTNKEKGLPETLIKVQRLADLKDAKTVNQATIADKSLEGEKIGRGGFSEVIQYKRDNGDEFAIKLGSSDEEIYNLLLLNHIEGVVKLKGAFDVGDGRGPNLFLEKLDEMPDVSSKEAFLKTANQLIKTYDEMKKAGFDHLDIKPSNILYRSKTEEPVFIDFGPAEAGTNGYSAGVTAEIALARALIDFSLPKQIPLLKQQHAIIEDVLKTKAPNLSKEQNEQFFRLWFDGPFDFSFTNGRSSYLSGYEEFRQNRFTAGFNALSRKKFEIFSEMLATDRDGFLKLIEPLPEQVGFFTKPLPDEIRAASPEEFLMIANRAASAKMLAEIESKARFLDFEKEGLDLLNDPVINLLRDVELGKRSLHEVLSVLNGT